MPYCIYLWSFFISPADASFISLLRPSFAPVLGIASAFHCLMTRRGDNESAGHAPELEGNTPTFPARIFTVPSIAPRQAESTQQPVPL